MRYLVKGYGYSDREIVLSYGYMILVLHI